MKSYCIFLVAYFIYVIPSFSQVVNTEEGSLETKAEQLVSASGDEQPDLNYLADAWHELSENPLNLNKAGYDELMSCGLFSEQQISALLMHRERYGKLLTLIELLVVPHFEAEFIRSISALVTTGTDIDEPNTGLGRMLKDGTHTIVLRTGLVPEQKRGYLNEGDGARYQGDPHSLLVRYKFNFMRKLSFAFAAEKDEGEVFRFSKSRKGFDFYTGHFAIRNIGKIRLLTIGDYQISYGQGLVINGAFASGSSSDPVSINAVTNGIRPYSSTGESMFKRGIALSMGKQKFQFDGFLSYRKLDANLNEADTLSGPDQFSSFQTSGLHRTDAEIQDQNALTELLYGGHVRYKGRNFNFGLTGYGSRYNLALLRDRQAYNQFEFSGKHLLGLGLNYSYLFRNVYLFGETAIDKNGVPATLNGIILSADSKVAFSVLHRHYPYDYINIYSGPFRKSSKAINETGIYSGLSIKPSRVWSLLLSYDQFRFPWLKYRVDAPSRGSDFTLQLLYQPSRNTQLTFRFTSRNGETGFDDNPFLTSRIDRTLHRGYRIHIGSKISKTFSLRTRAEFIRYRSDISASNGFMIYQDIHYHPMNSRWKINLRYVMMDTDDYDSRIYAYENDVLYSFSMSAYSDSGSRMLFNVRYKLSSSVDVWFRYAATFYNNRQTIGSGWDEIQGNRKSDLTLQLRLVL